MDFNSELRDYIKSLGLDAFGIIECREFTELKEYLEKRQEDRIENEFEDKDIERRINPFVYYKDGKSILSIAFPYYDGDETPEGQIHFSKYTRGEDYHKVVHSYLEKILEFIRSKGGDGIALVDSHGLNERYMASLAGVGFIGKNNMIITKKYGSFVFLGEIIFNKVVEYDKKIENLCKDCVKCLKACPSKAITKDGCKPNICLSYITQKKDLEDKWFKLMGSRIFGCDTCQDVCPFNENLERTFISEFWAKECIQNVNVNDIMKMSNQDFKDTIKKSSCGWRGKNIIQRNVIISSKNVFKEPDIDMEKIKSPYVKEYYDRVYKTDN